MALREAEHHFGSLWRLIEQDPKEWKRLTGLYSSRLPMYQAFEHEYGRHGRAVGVSGVLSLLKQKHPNTRGAKVVIKAMAAEYRAQS